MFENAAEALLAFAQGSFRPRSFGSVPRAVESSACKQNVSLCPAARLGACNEADSARPPPAHQRHVDRRAGPKRLAARLHGLALRGERVIRDVRNGNGVTVKKPRKPFGTPIGDAMPAKKWRTGDIAPTTFDNH